jgi:hypothetical protein
MTTDNYGAIAVGARRRAEATAGEQSTAMSGR